MIKKIESTQHPLIKEICSLHLAKYRAKTEKFIAEGNRTIRTLVAAGIAIDTLYYVSDAHLADLLVPDHQCVMVTEHVMKKISTSVTPSGTLAVFFKPKNRTLADITSEKTGLILLDIADPGNMGTLIRTAAAVNNHTIILIGGVDPWHPRVIQASAGTIGLVTIIETTWTDIKKELSNSLCALVVSGGIAPDQLVSEKKTIFSSRQ